MPISERKFAANQANARRSTGPRTPEGKRAAARNALTHGLSSRNVLLPGESEREYRRFGQRLFEDLAPDGVLEGELALEIVNLSWKLRRVPGVETTLLVEQHGQDEPPPLRVICQMITAKRMWNHAPNSPLWVVDRYAVRLERARASALRMLLTLQKRRRDADRDAGEEVADDGAAIAPLQNEPTATPDAGAAQPVVSTTDVRDVASPAAPGVMPNEATAAS